jgi:outer membrane protein assembly factor BamB
VKPEVNKLHRIRRFEEGLAQNGSAVWSFNILERFKGSNPKWHISESPLIDGNNLIVTSGGKGA